MRARGAAAGILMQMAAAQWTARGLFARALQFARSTVFSSRLLLPGTPLLGHPWLIAPIRRRSPLTRALFAADSVAAPHCTEPRLHATGLDKALRLPSTARVATLRNPGPLQAGDSPMMLQSTNSAGNKGSLPPRGSKGPRVLVEKST